MALDERILKHIQKRMQYTDDQARVFGENPRNAVILSKSAQLRKKQFVAEVISSNGCNSRHKAGTKIYLDGEGNLLPDKHSFKICIHILKSISPIVSMMQEMFYTDMDPNQIRFNRCQCIDVGIECGGWGRVVLDVRMEDKEPE